MTKENCLPQIPPEHLRKRWMRRHSLTSWLFWKSNFYQSHHNPHTHPLPFCFPILPCKMKFHCSGNPLWHLFTVIMESRSKANSKQGTPTTSIHFLWQFIFEWPAWCPSPIPLSHEDKTCHPLMAWNQFVTSHIGKVSPGHANFLSPT